MAKRKYEASFTQRLLALISEPGFIVFENMLGEPNIFKIVGRTHYERWHASFFGWLLDVNGSHLLADYVLRRFLLLLLNEKCLRASNHTESFLAAVVPFVEFSEIQVAPNENMYSETSVSGVGRFDIFLTATFSNGEGDPGNLNVLFELKIDSKPDGNQSSRYADWIYANHPNDVNLLIYLTPRLLDDSKSTVGDERWYCMDYQFVNDNLLIPLLDHPNLNEKVKPFIIQYIKNLGYRYKGIRMAITNEEKRLALALYDKYSDVFDAIYDALVSLGAIDYNPADAAENRGRATGRLAVRINRRVISNETVRLLFKDVLVYLVDSEHILRVPLPWGEGKQRYIVTNEALPIHPNGREFFYPESYKGYTIETHYARDRAMKVLSDLCERFELGFEVIDV